MSILDKNLVNPAQKYIQWSGSEGKFYFYDKEKKEKIYYPKPFSIIVLDTLTTIVGYDSANECGIWANEVHNLNDVLTVNSQKAGLLMQGKYSEIKDKLLGAGAKFALSVYAVHIQNDKIGEIVNIKLFGSSVGSYIKNKVKDGTKITLSPSTELLKKGATKFYAPVIERNNLEINLFEKSQEIYKNLFLPYFKQNTKMNNHDDKNVSFLDDSLLDDSVIMAD
jgi:hypothetical protein